MSQTNAELRLKFEILFYAPQKLFIETSPKLYISFLICSEYIFMFYLLQKLGKVVKFGHVVSALIWDIVYSFEILWIYDKKQL